jgi:hypothetical protein
VSFVEMVGRAILRASCARARVGIMTGFLIAFLAAFGVADRAFGEIIANLQPVSGVSGFYSDTASYSIADINAAGGIVIGDVLFDSFSVVPTSSVGAASPGAASILLTGVEVNGDFGFKVNALWTASATQWINDTLTFHASLLPESVAQGQAFVGNDLYITAVGGANTLGGIASISENLFANYPGLHGPSFAGDFVYYTSAGDQYLRDGTTFAPIANLWAVKAIGVSGGTGTRGAMTLSEFFEILHSVPEPSTIVLLGVGAFGIAGFAWRKRKG